MYHNISSPYGGRGVQDARPKLITYGMPHQTFQGRIFSARTANINDLSFFESFFQGSQLGFQVFKFFKVVKLLMLLDVFVSRRFHYFLDFQVF